MDFIGKLGKYKIIETEDQTKTLWSEYFDEACHNLSGAYQETLYNYIEGCNIPEQIGMIKNIHVLDVGFGVGIGLKAYLSELNKHTHSSERLLSYTSIELDEDLFLWSIKENLNDLIFKKLDFAEIYEALYKLENGPYVSIRIYIGDGRKTLLEALRQSMLPKFTAIFQDAFSPKKNPTLWTVEWFEDLKSMSDPEVFLSTYSSSVSIRKSMIKAGWNITNAKGFGQKRTMTKARLLGMTELSVQAELSRSPALELRDISVKI